MLTSTKLTNFFKSLNRWTYYSTISQIYQQSNLVSFQQLLNRKSLICTHLDLLRAHSLHVLPQAYSLKSAVRFIIQIDLHVSRFDTINCTLHWQQSWMHPHVWSIHDHLSPSDVWRMISPLPSSVPKKKIVKLPNWTPLHPSVKIPTAFFCWIMWVHPPPWNKSRRSSMSKLPILPFK